MSPVTIVETGSLQSLLRALPPMAQSCRIEEHAFSVAAAKTGHPRASEVTAGKTRPSARVGRLRRKTRRSCETVVSHRDMRGKRPAANKFRLATALGFSTTLNCVINRVDFVPERHRPPARRRPATEITRPRALAPARQALQHPHRADVLRLGGALHPVSSSAAASSRDGR